MTAVGFWGLVFHILYFVIYFYHIALKVEPGKTYSQEVDADFTITMASLGPKLKNDNSRMTVQVLYEEEEISLCNLIPYKTDSQPLNITFVEGDEITFTVEGAHPVYLSGNYVIHESLSPHNHDHDHNEYDSEEDDFIDDEADEDEEEEMDEEEEAELIKMLSNKYKKLGNAKSVEEDEEVEIVSNGKRKSNGVQEKPVSETKKVKIEQPKQENVKESLKKEKKEQKKEEKKEQKKEEKKEQKKEEKKEDKKVKKHKEDKKSAVRTMESGLQIEDLTIGSGKVANKGAKVSVRYIGKLTNGKVFDQNTNGSPFSFKLGAGQVIQGWDSGIDGMQVGGSRKLRIPPNLAYGSRGAPPDIPPNSTLEFEVRLLDVQSKKK
ncbi:peptidylprolyl isomerase fpr4 [Nowakowskiella sp. JEL0078]|nr:peptidylprolyl isomerase fpr4 [Nowakowskiella sp. JEL0078]